MHRAAVEFLLGWKLRGDRLHLEPCIPRAWPSYRIDFRHRSARYVLTVRNPDHVGGGISRVTLDGKAATTPIPLATEGEHTIEVVLGKGSG